MSTANCNPSLIELKGVSKIFTRPRSLIARLAAKLGAGIREQAVVAVDGVDLEVREKEVVGLAGESGCGKSTLGRIIAGILVPSGGKLFFRGSNTATLSSSAHRHFMLNVQLIFQDPFSSLNPRMKVRDIIGEAPLSHGIWSKGEFIDRLDDVMTRVGLDPSYKNRYPHQFSGGQRQRIGIARALAVDPECILCDEAVAALDVSIQAQILNLFIKLREDLNLTYLFISHDLGVLEHLSDRLLVMYLGRIVESAPTEIIFATPNHPYTQALLDCIPSLASRHKSFAAVTGEIPSPLSPPSGCHFHPRCPHAFQRCRTETPMLQGIGSRHLSACHLNHTEG